MKKYTVLYNIIFVLDKYLLVDNISKKKIVNGVSGSNC